MRITKTEMVLELASMFHNHKLNVLDGMDGMTEVLGQAKYLGKSSYKKFCTEIGQSPDSPIIREIESWKD